MDEKSKKVSRAAKLGRRIAFWDKIENFAILLKQFSMEKRMEYTIERDTLLRDVVYNKAYTNYAEW